LVEKIKLLKSVLGQYRNSGEEVLFSCPKCEHHKKKLSINASKGVFKCWICDWSGKNISYIVRKYGTRAQYQKWLQVAGEADLYEEENVEVIEPLKLPEEWVNLLDPSRNNSQPLKYLKARGIGRDEIIKWKLGYCPEGPFKDRIVFPSFDASGKLNFFTARTFKNSPLKYKNSKGSRDIVFNELMVDWSKDVILVEGPVDAIKAGNAIPLLGSTLRERSKLFQTVCNRKKEIYLSLDRDASGKELSIIKMFLDYGLKVRTFSPELGMDLGDMSTSEVKMIKDQAKEVTRDYLFYNNIFNMELV
tara:strand:- start:408 stop:1319 length:912 start_codon:yes stop_codon:yes gene_type:complete